MRPADAVRPGPPRRSPRLGADVPKQRLGEHRREHEPTRPWETRPLQATATSTNSATWTTAQTVDLVPLLRPDRPRDAADRVSGRRRGSHARVDRRRRGLGSGSICAPNSADWAPVPLSTTSARQTDASPRRPRRRRRSTRARARIQPITFTFFSRPSCNGPPMGVGAVARRRLAARGEHGLALRRHLRRLEQDVGDAQPGGNHRTRGRGRASLAGYTPPTPPNLASDRKRRSWRGNGLVAEQRRTRRRGSRAQARTAARRRRPPERRDWTTETIALTPARHVAGDRSCTRPSNLSRRRLHPRHRHGRPA